MKRCDEALGYWRRVLAIDPWRAEDHHSRGLVLLQLQDWPAAAEACRTALRLNPANIEARLILVECYLKMGRNAEARDEFMIVLGYDPPHRDALARWYADRQELGKTAGNRVQPEKR
jgi:tetratricopeptide (TPR) repeat protein